MTISILTTQAQIIHGIPAPDTFDIRYWAVCIDMYCAIAGLDITSKDVVKAQRTDTDKFTWDPSQLPLSEVDAIAKAAGLEHLDSRFAQ